MTRINQFLRVAFLLVVLGGVHSAFAQNPPLDSLNGKTVHVYLPSDDIDTLIPQNNMNERPLTKTGYWYSGPLRGGPYDHNDGFFFSTPGRRMNLSKSGLGTTEGVRIQKADFQGKNEMWIIVDPAGPVTAPPVILLEPPKVVNILNPWETTGPRLVLTGGKKSMATVHGHCGWFTAFLLKPTDLQLRFEEINGTDTYGKGGLGSAVNYDLTADFATKGVASPHGMILWLDTDLNSWLPAYPNKDGSCQYMMAATVRDFSKNHPDFEHTAAQYTVVDGMVQQALGVAGGKREPVRTAKTAPWPIFNDFKSWWNTDSTNPNPSLRSYETCVDIPMSKANDGLWEYDSYRTPEKGFYPIDNFNRHNETATTCSMGPPPANLWTNQTVPHNMNFCMESHASFIYRKGQKFEFRGDDDVWVFINDRLVIDLGGLHIPVSSTIDLDKLGLTEGSEYKWDFYYCERQPCGSSLKIKTSIFFKQQKSLFIEQTTPAPGTVSAVIKKREGGKGSCASGGDTVTSIVTPQNLIFQLWDATGKVITPPALGPGKWYNDGIVISSPNLVTVDTSKIRTLPAGNYRIVAFEPANEKVRVEIPFKVSPRNLVEFHQPAGDTSVPLGTLVRLILANKEKNVLIPAATVYRPVLPPGLEVYLDAGKTQPVTAATVLSTDTTGYDTLWVTDTALAVANKTYSLSIPLTMPVVRITFRVPKVAFQAPLTGSHPLGTLVPVVAVNSEKDVPGRYTPVIPPGLEVYEDEGRTRRVTPGTTLSTDAAGNDTLWITGATTATTDQTYVMSIPGSNQVSHTFLVPKNRVEFQPGPFARTVPMNSLVQLTTRNMENGQPVAKAESYILVIPPGLEVYADAAKTQRVAANATLTTAADGWDTLWVTADSNANNLETTTHILTITTSPQAMTLTFEMSPLVLPKALTATMHDEDADGIPDRLAVVYDRDISGSLPKAVEFKWPSSGAAIAIPPGELPGKVTGANLVHLGTFAAAAATVGEGLYTSTYLARKRDSVQTIPILDRMGPIIVKAEVTLGPTHDTLRIRLSESIPAGRITGAPGALFGYKTLPDAEPVAMEPAGMSWNADHTELTLVFPITSPNIPKAGNLVRINDGPGLIADVHGNTAGPASRFRLITGVKRSEIQTVTYKEIAPPQSLLREPLVMPSLQPINAEVAEVVERTGRMGHLIKTDLGDFAVADDFIKIQPSQVTLEYQASYFTNHGVPVASDKRLLACTDPIFQGDCLKNRGFLFIGWNYTAVTGDKVATGAYVSRIRYQVKVAGKTRESGGLDQVWGVLRKQ